MNEDYIREDAANIGINGVYLKPITKDMLHAILKKAGLYE